MTNSADPDQLASEEAYWSGSTLFAMTGYVVFSKRRVNDKTNATYEITDAQTKQGGNRRTVLERSVGKLRGEGLGEGA